MKLVLVPIDPCTTLRENPARPGKLDDTNPIGAGGKSSLGDLRATSKHRRSGFSLLEIVLALALAGIALALLSQLVGLANRAAAASRDLTKAQLIAESVMAEFASGVMLPQSTSGMWEVDPTWTFDAQVEAGMSENLNVITVTVTQAVDDPNPASFSLTQFLFIPPEPVEETDATATETGGGV